MTHFIFFFVIPVYAGIQEFFKGFAKKNNRGII
jgi:hypothetical protein